MEMFQSKMMKQTPPSDGIEKLEIDKTESKKEEVKAEPESHGQPEDRQPDPIATTDG